MAVGRFDPRLRWLPGWVPIEKGCIRLVTTWIRRYGRVDEGGGLHIGASASRDLARTMLAVLCLAVLIGASVWVLRPFLPALIWATMLVVATWPLLLRVQAMLGGRRSLAVGVMSLALIVVVAIPLFVAIQTIVEAAPKLIEWSRTVSGLSVPAPPAWLGQLPLVGARLSGRWEEISALPAGDLSERLAPFVRPAALWFVGQVGSLGLLLVHVLLTTVLAAILYARGETAAAGLTAFFRRLAGPRGERAVQLAGGAIRGVALGVIATALLQSALAGLGLAVAGVPYAGVLTAVMFLLGVAQVGPVPILLGSVAWLYWTGAASYATALLAWTVIVGPIDNVLRPILIRRGGGGLPLLLVFAGVIGGIIAFGIIGLFIGPVVLAVSYTFLVDWIAEPVQDATLAERPAGALPEERPA
jgi:predicted PurR-regulated permease PerM